MATPSTIEINVDSWLQAVTFSANGDYLVSGECGGVRVRGVGDAREMASTAMTVRGTVVCVAVSKDGRRIGAVTDYGDVFVWDARTYEQVWSHKQNNDGAIFGIDFSADSTQLVAPSEDECTASVWDIATGQRLLLLPHDREVKAAKYSPLGDRIATATIGGVQVYDSNDGRLLASIPVGVTPYYNTGLLWSNNWRLLVVSDRTIVEFDASTGSTISEWPVPESNTSSTSSCIAHSRHGELIVYSTTRTITIWDTSTHTQLSLIQYPTVIRSISVSPDGQFLAIAGEDGKIFIESLSRIIGLEIRIDDAALESWMLNQFVTAEALLTAAIPTPQNPSHCALASRALVRARLQQWDAAVEDATESIKISPSVIGYIAKSVALVGKGERRKAYRACDIAFQRSHSTHVPFLLLVKAIIVFMAGEYNDAMARVDDLIATVQMNSTCHVIQAHMHLLLGDSRMESGDYEGAIRSFERAGAQTRYQTSQALSVISLISGWKFDDLDTTVRRRLCEALYIAGCTREAGESVLDLVNTVDKEVRMTEPIITWVLDFMQRCLSTSGSTEDTTVHLVVPTPLLRKWAELKLTVGSWNDALIAAADFMAPRHTIYQALCDHLEITNRVTDAVKCFNQMNSELARETTAHDERARWAADFTQRCAGKLEHMGDMAMGAQRLDEAITQYSTALSLHPVTPQVVFMKRSKVYIAKGLWGNAIDDTNQVMMIDPSFPWGYERALVEWAKANLTDGAWRNALKTARGFKAPGFAIYQALCERLEALGCITDAIECFRDMARNSAEETNDEQMKWVIDFTSRCRGKLEDLGDLAWSTQKHDEAISWYSAALSLNPVVPKDIYMKRSKVYMAMDLWENAIDDANQVISLDPSSPCGYERKHAALHRAGCHDAAIETFETMLLKLSQLPDPEAHGLHHKYVHPEQTKSAIRAAIENALRHVPPVLIDTESGRLLDRSEQARSFESRPIFRKLISSMTTHLNHAYIEHEVAEYYRYATFSHKWEDNEPLFEQVVRIVVYELDESLTHDKLQMFCKIVWDSGFHWAWSDTCCINKADHFVLQEALVSMFKWYEGSAVTIVLLRGVRSPAKRGDLVRSIWNTRAWTLQEYHASKVVRFYTEDWKPYPNLDIPNHKESPEIIAEMEEATGVSARALMTLRPGLDNIRAKLHLASARHTTWVEDAAYSLLGIFSMSLPVVYGEGDKALGRLLAQLLTSSGDTSILAWTGRSGSFNSCLPATNIVFNQPQTTHIPPALKRSDTDKIIAKLRSSSLHSATLLELYDRLRALPVPSFAGQRMKLPCLSFKLGPLSVSWSKSGVFRAQTVVGSVEITTEEDLSRFDPLYLVHPWIDFLLEDSTAGDHSSLIGDPELLPFTSPSNITSTAPQKRVARRFPRFGLSFSGRTARHSQDTDSFSGQPAPDTPLPQPRSYTESLHPPSSLSPMEHEMRALHVIARLRQPFGALLLTPHPSNVAAYRRVAAESLIAVQVDEVTPTLLKKLVESVSILDVL